MVRRWLVHRLCDLHTWLSLARFRVDDWLERLDPTVTTKAKGKLYWFDGNRVREQDLPMRVTRR